MKIKKVKYPIPSEKDVLGGYDSNKKEILVKKYSRYQEVTIFHEYGHYIIDLIGIYPIIKHYLNLLWEYIWIIFDIVPISKKKDQFLWITNYYKKAKINNTYVY